jgi:hypothetical protein
MTSVTAGVAEDVLCDEGEVSEVKAPHRRPDMAPLVTTGFPVDGQISPR